MKPEMTESNRVDRGGCNVNSAFNFTVGGFAIAAAVLIAYMLLVYWHR